MTLYGSEGGADIDEFLRIWAGRSTWAKATRDGKLTITGKREGGTYEEKERAKTDWLRQFTGSYGTEENDEFTTFNGSL